MERRRDYRCGSDDAPKKPVLRYADVARKCAKNLDSIPLIDDEIETFKEPEPKCGRIHQIMTPVPDVSDAEDALQYRLASLHYKLKMKNPLNTHTGASVSVCKESWFEEYEKDSKYLLETINDVYNEHDISPLSEQEWEDLIYHCEA